MTVLEPSLLLLNWQYWAFLQTIFRKLLFRSLLLLSSWSMVLVFTIRGKVSCSMSSGKIFSHLFPKYFVLTLSPLCDLASAWLKSWTKSIRIFCFQLQISHRKSHNCGFRPVDHWWTIFLLGQCILGEGPLQLSLYNNFKAYQQFSLMVRLCHILRPKSFLSTLSCFPSFEHGQR